MKVSVNGKSYFHPEKNGDLKIKQKTFWLGTDRYGRDILSRLIIGVRVSLAVGLITVILSLSIGIFLGALAGYYGGKTDQLIMWLLNVIWSIPTLLLFLPSPCYWERVSGRFSLPSV